MATDDISQKFKGIKLSENQDINILLLGETGVGKSTFINSIANYLHFRSFKKAAKADDLLILIPSVITVTNQNYEQVTLTIGSDKNEYQEIGAAGTQDVKTYVFPIGEGKTRLRLIDSPGMGDPRGIEQDDINCENILAYLAQVKELHAICFLMKPTTTRKTILFEYCVKQILSRLEKSASKNIIFIFTNTRGTNYSPGETLPCLQTIINDIKAQPPNVEIPLRNNIFSFDNEAFRFLVAMKKGITFHESVQERFVESWKKSSAECWKLISYILGDTSRDGLKPHQLYNTISINEARRIIVQLSQPLGDITQLIHDNIRILDRHQHHLRMDNQSLEELKKKLHIPVINLEVTQLTQPVTVCTSSKCAVLVQVGEVQKWHYRQRCHDPCYLTNVTKEIIGDVNLMHCAAMNGRTCMKCTCDFSVHMHVYYLTRTFDDKIEDKVVKDSINKKEEALRESQRLIGQIDQRKRELEEERNVIVKSTAQFAHFLQHNAITPFNDSYKGYIQYLINREQSLGRNGDTEVIHNLEQLLRQYEEIKGAFESSLQLEKQYGLNTVKQSSVTAESVLNTVHQLYQLKHNGKKIHELLKKQKASRKSEYNENCEYIHPKSSDLSQSESKKDKSKKDKKKDGKTDDEGKKKDKQKDGNSTDDQRKFNKGPHNRNLQSQNRNRPYHHGQQVPQPSPIPSLFQEPPPPYDATQNYGPSGQISSYQSKDGEPNVVVKVELNQPGKPSQGQNQSRPSDQSYPHGPYYGGPYPHYGPPLHQGPYPGPYYGPPSNQGPYYGPPQNQGPHHGPSLNQGSYYGPPQGPPSGGLYYQSHQGHYGPPQGQYHGGPPGQHQGGYNRQQNQGNRGKNYNKRGGSSGGKGQRGRSQQRHSKGKKSDKGSRSSDSGSSSD